eukprot:g2380.t1
MGASAGKKALHRMLDALVAGNGASKEDIGIIFDSYVGKPTDPTDKGPCMTVSQITKIFKDLVAYQRKVGMNLFTAASAAYYQTPEYKTMGFVEKAGVSTMIFGLKTTVVSIFDVAMSTYTSSEKMNKMLRKFSPDGVVRRDVFVQKAPAIIGAELVSANLIVGKDIADKFPK